MNDNINEADNIAANQFVIIRDTLSLFKLQISALQRHINIVEKNVKKSSKIKQPKIKAKRSPSGFAKPAKITKELCEFINKPEGTEMARTEVTKALVEYIKKNKLIGNSAPTEPDVKLITLLDIDKDEYHKLTYFNIQKHMNKHFINKNTIDSEHDINI